MTTKQEMGELKGRAFSMYLNQYPNINFTLIADEVERDRSRVSRWAIDGGWSAIAERLHERAEEKSEADLDSDAQGKEFAEQLEDAASFEDLLRMLGDSAAKVIVKGVKFTTANEVIRFMELVDKHEEKKKMKNERSNADPLTGSSLPQQEEDAIRAGLLIVKYARRPDIGG